MEILLATLGNLQFVFFIAAAILFSTLVITGISWLVAHGIDDDGVRKSKRVFVRLIPFTIIAGLLACIPTMDDMWKVRIALIKYQLASPENVKAGVERINEIADGLECKYLGNRCPAKKE